MAGRHSWGWGCWGARWVVLGNIPQPNPATMEEPPQIRQQQQATPTHKALSQGVDSGLSGSGVSGSHILASSSKYILRAWLGLSGLGRIKWWWSSVQKDGL